MDPHFKGKTALITGAGKGIGRDVAKRLSELGADTIALSRTQTDLDSLKEESPTIRTVQCDLGDWDVTRALLGTVGNVDLLVNNAGVAKLDSFLEAKKEDLDWVFDINYKALFNVSQVVAKSMVARGQGGIIVNVSSIASMVSLKNHAVYCSTKAAVDQLTKVMALELGPHKIRVNAVNPTVVMTEMGKYAWSDPAKSKAMLDRIPMGKFVEVSDVVDSIVFLLSDKAKMIHGVTLPIEGGLLTS